MARNRPIRTNPPTGRGPLCLRESRRRLRQPLDLGVKVGACHPQLAEPPTARWRGRVRRREIVVRVTTRPCDREKLVAAGYVAPAHRDDRESIGTPEPQGRRAHLPHGDHAALVLKAAVSPAVLGQTGLPLIDIIGEWRSLKPSAAIWNSAAFGPRIETAISILPPMRSPVS